MSLLYYREKKTGDSKRPSLRVVAVEDLWETLMGVHEQVCHRSLLIATAEGRYARCLAVALSTDWSDLLSGRGPHG